MRVRIHHGAHEVGGNCVEIEAFDGSRIALDLGRPLTAAPNDAIPIPVFEGPLLGVLITHPHLDHYGLVGDLDGDVPVFIGEEASRILGAAAFFSPMTRPFAAAGYFHDRVPFEIGPYTITPYLVDHSAFDSYSLLVEVDGKRLFYTGDFRGHGRKARLFDDLLANAPQRIDVLITEGTHIALDPAQDDTHSPTEGDLEVELAALCRDTAGSVVAFGSAQNIDRLVTVFRAARRAGREFVTDLYAATVAAATRPTIPQPGFDDYRVYVPKRQRVLVTTSGEFDRVEHIRDLRIFGEQLAAEPGRYLMYLPSSTVRELIRSGALGTRSRALWSMWDGYLAEPSGRRLVSDLAAAGIPFSSLHTSGHATVDDLRRLAAALVPTHVVPIHTDAPNRFVDLFERTTLHADGTWWSA
jgi:ribonuclease J